MSGPMRLREAEIMSEVVAAVRAGASTTPAIRLVRRRVSKQTADFDCGRLLRFAHELICKAPSGRFIAYELVTHHAPTMESITLAEVEALGRGMSSWAETDTFSVYVAGPAWRAGRITDEAVGRWARSDDRWWRRAALVSTVPLNNGPVGESRRTLRICKMLIDDRDDMVVKGMSWALRALSKRAPEQVKQFLDDNGDRLAPRVIREVTNKLATGLKNP